MITMIIPAWIINCLILNLPRSFSEWSSSPKVGNLGLQGLLFLLENASLMFCSTSSTLIFKAEDLLWPLSLRTV